MFIFNPAMVSLEEESGKGELNVYCYTLLELLGRSIILPVNCGKSRENWGLVGTKGNKWGRLLRIIREKWSFGFLACWIIA